MGRSGRRASGPLRRCYCRSGQRRVVQRRPGELGRECRWTGLASRVAVGLSQRARVVLDGAAGGIGVDAGARGCAWLVLSSCRNSFTKRRRVRREPTGAVATGASGGRGPVRTLVSGDSSIWGQYSVRSQAWPRLVERTFLTSGCQMPPSGCCPALGRAESWMSLPVERDPIAHDKDTVRDAQRRRDSASRARRKTSLTATTASF